MEHFDYSDRYLRLLSQKFRTVQEVSTELINLEAILALPKGTEHFMSDIHGEDEAFAHILNNCSGVVRDKIDAVYGDTLTAGNGRNWQPSSTTPSTSWNTSRHT